MNKPSYAPAMHSGLRAALFLLLGACIPDPVAKQERTGINAAATMMHTRAAKPAAPCNEAENDMKAQLWLQYRPEMNGEGDDVYRLGEDTIRVARRDANETDLKALPAIPGMQELLQANRLSLISGGMRFSNGTNVTVSTLCEKDPE